MDLYPAIDLRDGRCVRLVEGDFDRETVYGDDPLLVARGFVAAGARWIHVVDLDAARRQGDNRAVIAGLAAALPIPIEVGGGVRDGSLLDGGVARVVVGSLAVEDPDAVRSLAGGLSGPGGGRRRPSKRLGPGAGLGGGRRRERRRGARPSGGRAAGRR